MNKWFNTFSLWFTSIGTIITTALGGMDQWMYALIAFICIDYITGVMKSIYNKRLSSAVGFKGIIKKVMILICVAVSVIVERVTNLPVRSVVVCFYLANEGISLLENISEFVSIPIKLKEILLQIRDQKDHSKGGD